MLVKCSNMLMSKQELSVQQVASSLLGFEDHFTDHQFCTFYWKAFESYIGSQEHKFNSLSANTSLPQTIDHVDNSTDSDSNLYLDESEEANFESVIVSRNVFGGLSCKAN